jgi:hypothetical protein
MPTPEEIQNALAAYGPQQVTSDGTTVVNRSVEDLTKAASVLSTNQRKISDPWKRMVRFQSSDGAVAR